MSSDSFYRPPESSLATHADVGSSGSIEGALRGDYDLAIGEILSEAWALTNGSKAVIWGAAAIYAAASFGSQLLMVAIFGTQGDASDMAGSTLASTALGLLLYPLSVGMLLYSLRRASGDPEAGFADITGCYSKLLPLVLAQILSTTLTGLATLLLILPGIYLGFAYFFCGLLVAERDFGVWDALETSRKAITKHWFQFFGLSIVIGLAGLAGSVLTLGIGLIWLLPWMLLCYGVAYRRIFGTAVAPV